MKIADIDYKHLDGSEKIYMKDKVKYNDKFWKVVYAEYSFVFSSHFLTLENMENSSDRVTVFVNC
jgi:hypothetical protein